ncbi:hypothetical protein BDP27DRAFT_1222513 [Rhodocollybia butyracea]|uniref:Uncharacterized protein n=1 Tax=Rhodocollybia butyracea TaxID=206335 RepID=A0A9P5U908_9AGAR|nr:hypothetical protein BDP27DRAFT_1222513 [Rhodocollybia butyracea]
MICVSPIRILWAILLCSLSVTIAADIDADPDPQNGTHQELICIPFGECEPCPSDELDKPFCQPFGNRRLMHCKNATTSSSSYYTPSTHDPRAMFGPPGSEHNSKPGPHPPIRPVGETPAWESCGRIISQERADFYEFIACNVLFALCAILVVYVRSRRRHALHARQLAARIGLIRGSGTR